MKWRNTLICFYISNVTLSVIRDNLSFWEWEFYLKWIQDITDFEIFDPICQKAGAISKFQSTWLVPCPSGASGAENKRVVTWGNLTKARGVLGLERVEFCWWWRISVRIETFSLPQPPSSLILLDWKRNHHAFPSFLFGTAEILIRLQGFFWDFYFIFLKSVCLGWNFQFGLNFSLDWNFANIITRGCVSDASLKFAL